MMTKTLKMRRLAGGGKLPYIDPRQFTNPETDQPAPAYDPSRLTPFIRGEQWGSGSAITADRMMGAPGNPPAPSGSGMLGKAAGYANSIAPFASNIVNAFRKVPTPAQPIMDSAPVLQKVNMDAERSAVSREVNASSAASDRAVDGNTAERIRQANLGTKLNQFSQISEQERNANTNIANQQAMLSAQTASSNNSKRDQYNSDIKEGQIAQQREQSANFANAADKYVAIGNEKSKQQLEMRKANILKSLYDQSGVMRRLGARWKAAGQPDPMGQDYKWLDENYTGLPAPSGSLKRMGGSLKLKTY